MQMQMQIELKFIKSSQQRLSLIFEEYYSILLAQDLAT